MCHFSWEPLLFCRSDLFLDFQIRPFFVWCWFNSFGGSRFQQTQYLALPERAEIATNLNLTQTQVVTVTLSLYFALLLSLSSTLTLSLSLSILVFEIVIIFVFVFVFVFVFKSLLTFYKKIVSGQNLVSKPKIQVQEICSARCF